MIPVAIKKNSLVVRDAAWRKIVAGLRVLDRHELTVGIIGEAGHAKHVDSELTVLEIGAVHELGTEHIPQRSWLRRTFEEKADGLKEIQGKAIKALMEGKMDALRVLNTVGLWAATETRKTITTGPHIPPPLKPETIKRKGSDRPLVDTGQMVGAISHQVKVKQ